MALRLRAPAASGQIDEAEVRRALPFLCDPEGKVQFAPYPRFNSRCVVGPDREEVYQTIQRLAGDCRWLYWTINPIDPAADLEGRNARIGDILRRRWFLVDVDPKRPEGSMSTHDEHEHAREVAWNVVDDLGDRGWPSPWIIDSGSGFHLLWQVDLPNDRDDPRVRKQYGRVLAWLGKTHDSDRITIDANVGSANQNSKVPGTWVRKGANSPDRPHRLCRTVHLPEELECVPYQAIADLAGPDPPERPKPTVFEARAFGNDEGRLKAYGKAALSREIQRVLMSVAGENRNILYNAACYNLYRLVAGGCIDDAHCYAELLWAGQQIGLGEREARYHLDRARKQGMESPRAPEARPEPRLVRSSANGQSQQEGERQESPQQESSRTWTIVSDGRVICEGDPSQFLPELPVDDPYHKCYELVTLGRVIATDYPEPLWAVPGIMSEGLNFLAGAPKMGKSMLALNIAMTIAGGGMALGNHQCRMMDVLYLSLEDKQRRIKARAVKMMRSMREEHSEAIGRNLTIATSWPRQDEGGLRLIDVWRQRCENAGLFIIDVWNRFSPHYRQSGSTYTQDSEFMASVQSYANAYGMTALILHHTRKSPVGMAMGDYLQEVSGTMGLTGTADGILVLARVRGEDRATLHITGRDVGEEELVLQFDKETLSWVSLGTSREHVEGRVQQSVVNFLRGLGGRSEFAPEIAKSIHEKEDSVRNALRSLLERRIVRKVGNAWAFPGEGESESEAI